MNMPNDWCRTGIFLKKGEFENQDNRFINEMDNLIYALF